ncbi:sirohydrochlorin cobaltochelatase [Shewanella sp. TC10]|uniref:sirohydrochlorin cobaltochelatase n=1 Tax=Shewanella sp. TC10 TaxID=1419739 RepID=UPI00129E141A|nr:sirohydrochlorin cobaltochelatase [Shewanella sp. TC10]
MKRQRHYQQGRALILCCFGSVVAQERYQQLLQQAQARYPDYDVRLAVSSRMVIKKYQGDTLQTLPQVLAQLDANGHRQIVVASVYLFPTAEHQQLLDTVAGFYQFSLSRIVATPALLQPVNSANAILTELYNTIRQPDSHNLFIHHGAPDLAHSGYSAIWYSQQLLEQMSAQNHSCSLEGANPFSLVKQHLNQQLQTAKASKIQLVPMLLVSGNHFVNDVQKIASELDENTTTEVAKINDDNTFCLLDLPQTIQTLWKHIDTEFNKLGELT